MDTMKPTLGTGQNVLQCVMKVVDHMIVCRGGVKLWLRNNRQRMMNTCVRTQQGRATAIGEPTDM